MKQRDDLRNIAIIAHVDHGKTTLVDKLLQQSGAFRQNEQVEERVMDSNDLERERGITILAKNTAICYLDKTINIVDTPGHADFGGEVERILRMVDGCLLLVDAFEGVMPQTKFVLRKAMAQGLKIIVVINKIDRPMARPAEVLDETLELFMELEADDDQLEFPVIYASALNGISGDSPDKLEDNMKPLFEAILEHIPVPVAEDGPLQVQVTTLDYSDYLGKIGIGRIHRGAIRMGQTVAVIKRNGSVEKARVTKLMGYQGLKRVDIDEASAGDIVAYAGLGEIEIGETVADSESPEALPLITIDEPTVRMTFLVNDAPFAGREGKHVTSRKLRERLYKEMEKDVALRVEDTDSPEEFLVAGRGELHLSILIEKMRREGYEMAVSKPEVILREEEGQILEPVERAIIDVPEEFVGTIIEKLGSRKGEMVNMTTYNGQTRLEFLIPARGLIGFRNEFLTDTRGHGIINSSFDSYQPLRSTPVKRRQGALIAWETGKATSYGLQSVEDRGILFIEPGDEVYEGMIVGQNAREQDLDVNVCKQKAMTNVRSSTKEQTDGLKSARKLSLEEALEFLNDDEFCEITPLNIRLRKKYLQKHERERMAKTKK